jgi:DNA-binding NtrC family response regulator
MPNTAHILDRIRRGIYDMMNAPFKHDHTQAQISQRLRVGDKTLREIRSEEGQQVYIIQAAQINMQQTINEHGTHTLERLDQLRDLLLEQSAEGNIFQALLDKFNEGFTLAEVRDQVEKAYIMISLMNSPNRTAAAKRIGLARTTLGEKLKRIERKELEECETQNDTD